jgi:lipoyl(octanoyl) transferase
VHVSRWVTTHGYALNVDLDPAPFTDWITACGLEDAAFTTMAQELGRSIACDDVRPAAVDALADVFGLELEELPAEHGAGLWAQPVHERISAR